VFGSKQGKQDGLAHYAALLGVVVTSLSPSAA
jgi:hypothetical protein